MSDVIASLRKLRAKATGGTWSASPQVGKPSHCHMAQVFGPIPDERSVANIDSTDDPAEATANAAAIVAAMNSLPALLECAEALETVRGCGVLPISVGRIVDAALQALAEGGGE